MKRGSVLTLFSILFLCIISCVKADQEEIKGGVVLKVHNNFLKSIKNELIDSFVKAFRPKNLNFTYDFSAGELFDFHASIENLTMQNFYMTYEDSIIEFREKSPNIQMVFYNFQMNLTTDFNLTATPEFYRDVGHGEISFNFENMTIGLTIDEENGVFQFRTDGIDAHYLEGKSHFKGEGDVSYAVDAVTTLIEQQMQSNPSTTLNSIISPILNFINGQIASGGCTSDAQGLFINWCAMSSPNFTDSDVTLVFKGDVTPDPKTIAPFVDQRFIPIIHDPTETDVQLFISAYTLNSTLWAAYESGMIDFEVRTTDGKPDGEPITASTLGPLFPKLPELVGKDTQISIRVKANDELVPYLEIIAGETLAYMKLDISFATVDASGNRNEFLATTSNVNIEVDFEIQTPFTVKTDFKQIKIKAETITLDEYSLTNVEDLNAMIGTISGFIRNYINRMLTGYKLGEIDLGFTKMDVRKTSLSERNNYIYADLAPHFTSPVQSQVGYKVNTIKKKEITYEEQVQAMAKLIKLTPLYHSIKNLKENEQAYQGLQNIGAIGHFGGDARVLEENMPLERDEDEYSREKAQIQY